MPQSKGSQVATSAQHPCTSLIRTPSQRLEYFMLSLVGDRPRTPRVAMGVTFVYVQYEGGTHRCFTHKRQGCIQNHRTNRNHAGNPGIPGLMVIGQEFKSGDLETHRQGWGVVVRECGQQPWAGHRERRGGFVVEIQGGRTTRGGGGVVRRKSKQQQGGLGGGGCCSKKKRGRKQGWGGCCSPNWRTTTPPPPPPRATPLSGT